MGARLSRLFACQSAEPGVDGDPFSTPTQSLLDSLHDVAARHWLSLEQLHHLYIIAARTSFEFPCCPVRHVTSEVSDAAPPSGSPHLAPCSPPQSKCEPRRHCPECCSRFSSKASPASLLTVSHSPHQAFRPLSLEPSLPRPSPADVIAAPSGFGSCSYRAAADRDSLYRSRVRPSIESLLLETTPLDRDDLSIVLDYLIEPPQLTPPQVVSLALLSPQLLTDAKPPTQQPAPSASYSDLLLTSSGCFTHRKGTIDRTMSLRAKQLRLNFATIQTGLYRVTPDGTVRMAVFSTSEFWFDVLLHSNRRRRDWSLYIAPRDDARLEECRRRYEVCMANQLLLVCGSGV